MIPGTRGEEVRRARVGACVRAREGCSSEFMVWWVWLWDEVVWRDVAATGRGRCEVRDPGISVKLRGEKTFRDSLQYSTGPLQESQAEIL